MLKDVILALIAIMGPIISGVWSYKSAVKKSEVNLEAVKEQNKSDLEAIRIKTENELRKIQEQALADEQVHERKVKTELVAKQFENPEVQKLLGDAIGNLIKDTIEKKD